MNDYDFSTLNDKEFENLIIDLISKEEIIECKHYLKTGYNGLISSLKKIRED